MMSSAGFDVRHCGYALILMATSSMAGIEDCSVVMNCTHLTLAISTASK